MPDILTAFQEMSTKAGQAHRAIVTANIGSTASEAPLGFVAPDEAAKVCEAISQSFVIGGADEVESSRKPQNELERFKRVVIETVETTDETSFIQAVSVYREILQTYMRVGIRFGEQNVTEPFTRWHVLHLVQRDLTDIFGRSLRGKDPEFSGTVLAEYQRLFGDALGQRDLMIYQLMLEVFQGAYWLAWKARNERGVDRAHRFLVEFTDWTLLPRLEKESGAPALTLVPFVSATRNAREAILKMAIENDDRETVRLALEGLLKFFEYFDADNDRLPLIRTGADNPEDPVDVLVAGHADWATKVNYSAYSYVRELVEARKVKTEAGSALLSILESKMGNIQELLTWAESAWMDRVGRRWEHREETRGMWSEDPAARARWVLVLRGLRLLGGGTERIDFGPSGFIATSREDIENIVDLVVGSPSDWTWAVKHVTVETAGRFKDALGRADVDYKESVLQSVIDAKLDPERTRKFEEDVVKGYDTGGLVRALLKERGKLNVEPGLDAPPMGYSHYGPKEAFIDQERVSYVGWGDQYGRGIANGENHEIVAALVKNAPRIEAADQDIASLFGVAQAKMSAEGRRVSLFVVNDDFMLRHELEGDPEWIPGWQVKAEGEGSLLGIYRGVRVVGLREVAKDSVLAVDLDSACSVIEQSERPAVEIRIPPPPRPQSPTDATKKEDGKQPGQEVIIDVSKRIRINVENTDSVLLLKGSRK